MEPRARTEASLAHVLAAMDLISDAVLELDCSGCITDANRGALRLFGLSETALRGVPVADLVTDADRSRWERCLALALTGERQEHIPLTVRRGSGAVPAQASAAALRDGAGAVFALCVVMRDIEEQHITAQTLAESTLRAAESEAMVLRKANEQLTQTARYDELTGLANRGLLMEWLETILSLARQSGHRVDVLYLDVDDFMTINESRGHQVGDEVLAAVANILRQAMRASDTAPLFATACVARLGGDEFVLVLDDCADPGAVSRRILDQLKGPLQLASGEVFVSVSIGTATAVSPSAEDSPDRLLAAASVAMHEAKRAGKGQHVTFQPRMHEAARTRHELGNELHRAIDRGEFLGRLPAGRHARRDSRPGS